MSDPGTEGLLLGRRILSDLAIDFDRLTPLAGGGRNVVLSVDDRLVLRLSRDRTAELLLSEAEVLLRLGGHARFPSVLQVGSKDGWTFQIQRFIPGANPIHLWSGLTDTQKRSLIAGLCGDLRLVHGCTQDGFCKYNETPRHVSWRDYCSDEFQDLMARAEAGNVLVDYIQQCRLVFASYASALGAGRRGCLVHNDLWLGNLLVDQGELTAVLDFELAYWGEADLDLFKFEFFCRSPEDYGVEGDFADALPLFLEFYPELFVPDLARRLDLYDLIFTWHHVLYGVERGDREAESYLDFTRRHLDRLLGGRIRRLV